MKKQIRYSALFWGALVVSVVVAYVALAAGIFGLLPNHRVSIVALVGALVGGISALGYLITANREIERKFGARV